VAAEQKRLKSPVLKDCKKQYKLSWDYFSHNSPVDEARQVFKPSENAETLKTLVSGKNIGKVWI